MLLGIELSRTEVAVILASAEGHSQLALKSAVRVEEDAPGVWNRVVNTIREVLLRANVIPAKLAATGIAVEWPVDESGSVLKAAGVTSWEEFNFPRALQEALGLATVRVETHVVCEALAEKTFGTLRDVDDWVYVHIGRHLHSTAQVNGHWLRGAGQAALEIGAICIERDGVLCGSGRRGCLDGYCGGEAFTERARSYGLTFRQAHEIWETADGNWTARSLCEDYTSRLAQGLGAMMVLLNPARIVLGGALGLALGERLLHPLRLRLGEFCLPIHLQNFEMTLAHTGHDGAVIGAVVLAMEQMNGTLKTED